MIVKNINEIWQDRWKNADRLNHVSFLGKLMFKSKIKALKNTISTLQFDSVIEAGCGLGYTSKIFQSFGKNYIGIDISPDAVNYCLNKGLNVIQKNMNDVNETYDMVFSDGMLEHFLNFEPYVKKMTEISKKYVMLIQPNHESCVGKTLVFLSELLKNNVNVFEYNYRIKDFEEIFQKYSFNLIYNIPIFLDVFKLLIFNKENKA